MDAWLPRAAQTHPARAALVTPTGVLTYAELESRARAGAGALREQGVGPGDRVALALPAGEQFAVALHACLLLGAAAVPVDLRLGDSERSQRVAGCSYVVRAPLTGAPLSCAAAHEAGGVATLMHTSGTTAAPKPVPLTFGNWFAHALGSAVALGLLPEERWLCPLPLAHVGGLSILIRSAVYGTTVVLHERFEVESVLATLSDPGAGVTLVSLVPTMLARLLAAGLRRPPTVRWVLLGGGPSPPALLAQAKRAGVPVAPTYGMTEACSQIATHGWPLPGVQLRLAGDGEVLVRGPTVSPTALGPDGWLCTGDLGSFDSRGRLAIIGRKADTIVTGAENVAPGEVEAVLLEHEDVADVAVHGRPDEEWGEAVVATVVRRDGSAVTAAELLEHCSARLARFKVPKAVAFTDRLPRTASGKLLRREL